MNFNRRYAVIHGTNANANQLWNAKTFGQAIPWFETDPTP